VPDRLNRAAPLLAIGLAALPACGRAQGLDFHSEGLLDLRLVAPSSQRSNLDGGLGKLRWGQADAPVQPELGGLSWQGAVGLTPELWAVTDLRFDTQQRNAVDVLDAFVRYRPVSVTRWRWSVKAGAFFPPVSLENTGPGWTTEWTLTPSAIDAWVGDELRTIGSEGSLEWRGDVDRIEATVAVYGWNQPAGVAMADRGWSFNDRALGLLDHIRLPDASARALGSQGRLYSSEFRQIDGTPGWYAGIAWERPELGRVALLRYDNMADPTAHDGEFAWRTKFWSLGVSTEWAGVVLLMQAMVGSTVITPSPSFSSTTDFWAAYVLAGYERGDWRYAVRFDRFATDEHRPGAGPRGSEQGFAGTVAVTWSPRKWLQLTGELVGIDSVRDQRLLEDRPPRALEGQAQLAVRVRF
jgi:hypothetical protein